MDELSDKLSELMSDPESVEKLKILASSFLGGDKGNSDVGDIRSLRDTNEKEHERNKNEENKLMDMNPAMLLKAKHIMEQMNKTKTDDPKSRLLLALKPYMSPKRVASIEQAMKFMQIIQVFNMFGGELF